MRRNIQTMVDIVKFQFQNRITSKDENFIQLAIYKLIHLEMANLVWHKKVKGRIGTRQTEVGGKIKRPRSDTEFTQRPKSVAVSTPLPMSNILATFNDAFDPNQARLTVISPFPYEVADICLNICKEENMQDPVRLNVSYILLNRYDENQANNMFYQTLYQILYSSLQEEGVMSKVSRYKL